LVRSLADKRSREEHGLFVVEGRKMVQEALASGFRVERVFVMEGAALAAEEATGCGERASRRASQALDVPLSAPVPTMVSPKEMERLSLLRTPSDTLALVAIERPTLPQGPPKDLILALDDVQDPGNVGTIIRLADWFGIGDVVCSPATADCYAPKVVQATMGAIFRVRVHYTLLVPWLETQKAQGAEIFGTFMEGEDIYTAALSQSAVVVMGNEGRGITPVVEAVIARRLSIPPFPPQRRGSESLNVAIATAIVCSEFRRRI